MRHKSLALAMLALAPSADAAIDTRNLPLPLQCFGSEPFWSFVIHDARSATLKTDLGISKWKMKSVGQAALRPSTWRVTFYGNNRAAFIFDEGSKGCTDSDSDEAPPYALLLQDGEGLLRGCCTPKN